MSNNLTLTQVAAAQNQKEVTINDQAGQLDAGLTDKVDVSLTGTTSPLSLSDAQALRCMVLKLTGTHPGGAYEVHCPTNRKIYVVWNGAAGDVTFKTVAGTGILVNAGAVLILYCDGTDVIQLAGLVATIDDIGDVVITAAASGQMLRFNGSSWVNEDSPYDVGMFIPGTHGNGALMAQVVLTRGQLRRRVCRRARLRRGDRHRRDRARRPQERLPHRHDHLRDRRVDRHLCHRGRRCRGLRGGGPPRDHQRRPGGRHARRSLDHLSRQEDLTMAWGSDVAATQLTAITTEQFFDQAPTLNPREKAHLQVSVDFPGSPTDHAIVAVYTTLDDSSEVWDLIPMMEFLLENAADPNRISFLVTGVYKFRVGVRRSGSTDTITSADLSLRKDGVNA